MSRRTRFAANIILAICSLLISLLLVEMASRYWLNNWANDHQLSVYGTYEQIENSKTILFSRHHYLQYIGAPNYRQGENIHNEFGFRGEDVELPKPADIFRIVLLGGSTTYTTAVPNYKESYPYILQKLINSEANHLNVEVINAGLHAYSSWESLINLQFRVLDLEPDLVIVYHGINDVHPRLVYPQNVYRGDNSGARVPYEMPVESIYDSIAFIRIIRTNMGLRKPLGGLGFRRTFEFVPNNYTEQFRLQKRKGTYPQGIFKNVSALQMLKNNPPIYFRRNLVNMIAITKEHNVEIALMTFAFSPEFEELPRVSSPEYIKALGENNDVVKSICISHKIPCYDLAKEMPIDKEYWKDGRHVNKLGATKKAELVSKWLNASGLLP